MVVCEKFQKPHSIKQQGHIQLYIQNYIIYIYIKHTGLHTKYTVNSKAVRAIKEVFVCIQHEEMIQGQTY